VAQRSFLDVCDMLIPVEAEGRTGFRIQESEEQVSGVRCQVPEKQVSGPGVGCQGSQEQVSGNRG
jgi:hypothetical protein